jgi:hypothetical protein
MMIRYICKWVSTRWQWSVNKYTDRKETTIYTRRNNTQNTEHVTQKAKHTKEEEKHKSNNKNIKRVIRTQQRTKGIIQQ